MSHAKLRYKKYWLMTTILYFSQIEQEQWAMKMNKSKNKSVKRMKETSRNSHSFDLTHHHSVSII